MDPIEIQRLIEAGIDNATVQIVTDDNTHFQAIVVADEFEGLRPIARHQRGERGRNPVAVSGCVSPVALEVRVTKLASPRWNSPKLICSHGAPGTSITSVKATYGPSVSPW